MSVVKPGQQLASVVCDTRVVVVRAGAGEVLLTCGGAEMVDLRDAPEPSGQVPPAEAGPTAIGKRYVDEAGTLEVLCTRAGAGRLALDGAVLAVKAAKPLPSSD